MSTRIKFAQRLAEIRLRSNLSKTAMAKKLDVSPPVYQRYESDKRRPAFEQLVAMADRLCVSLDYLVGRTDDPDDSLFAHAGLLPGSNLSGNTETTMPYRIAIRLRTLREGKGLSQARAASESGVDLDAYQSYEDGSAALGISDAIRLARLYGVSVEYIACETDDPARH